MNKPLSIVAVCLFACALSAGCKKSVDAVGNKIVGKWKAKGVSEQGLTLEFKADKTFSFSPGGQMTGIYTFADGKLTMTFTNLGGTSFPSGTQPCYGSLSEDGETITISGVAGNKESSAFARVTSTL